MKEKTKEIQYYLELIGHNRKRKGEKVPERPGVNTRGNLSLIEDRLNFQENKDTIGDARKNKEGNN